MTSWKKWNGKQRSRERETEDARKRERDEWAEVPDEMGPVESMAEVARAALSRARDTPSEARRNQPAEAVLDAKLGEWFGLK